MTTYTRNRSQFWLKIYDNDDSSTILANEMTARAIHIRYPSISRANAGRGWKPLQDNPDCYSLWIPHRLMPWGDYQRLKAWAELAGNQCIWLSTNKNAEQLFTGAEVDFCVSYDWNLTAPYSPRTRVGEAEYQMKYHPNELSETERVQYCGILKNALKECLDCLPYDCRENHFFVVPIPATIAGQQKLAWKLAECAAAMLNLNMISLTLEKEKPPIKNMPIDRKADVWKNFLSNVVVSGELLNDLRRGNFLIVDDLYQSGVSIWRLAEYLKANLNANIVQAVTVVKSLGDGDNSWNKPLYYS